MIAKLNGTVPKGTNLEETVDDLVWNDEFEVRPGAEKPPAGAVERTRCCAKITSTTIVAAVAESALKH